MSVEDFSPATGFSDEERRFHRRQLAQQAINLAMQSRWEEAAEVNRQIVEVATDDAEAYNRLGKAYTELGQITEAREAYENALRADAANLIAQRNLERLSRITETEAAALARKAAHKLDPRFFMEETGKTGVTILEEPSAADVATLTAGDQVQLAAEDGKLNITTMDGKYVGHINSRLAQRLTRLMQSGNQYQAGVVGVDGNNVRVIIRETFQAPQNAGRISFPPQVAQALPRPYLREGLMRRSGDEEDEDEADVDISAEDVDDDEEDSSEFGFHEGTLDDE